MQLIPTIRDDQFLDRSLNVVHPNPQQKVLMAASKSVEALPTNIEDWTLTK
jgi:hypothetical protein